ncbi:unnamed protein product [Hydatigera taeniaeformis]|uniref:Pecanex-like protein n=1 Tax=Hydatigena taeniaeformis TaxID=6205 RepID=A0A0R3WQU6_HYDTA|nr:unnamed protein product [Hydatigera taeniaeformis]
MFNLISDFRSSIGVLHGKIIKSSIVYYYLSIILWTMLLFISWRRFPHCYSPWLSVVWLIGNVFVSSSRLWLNRLLDDMCIAESISYVIRPLVLILWPFIHISLGCFGAAFVGGGNYVGCLLYHHFFIIKRLFDVNSKVSIGNMFDVIFHRLQLLI